jgi:hypothetical protein
MIRGSRPPGTFLRLSMLALLAATVGACAARIGPIAGYEYGLPLTLERDAGKVNVYDFNGNGTSQNHTVAFGAAADWRDSLLGAVTLESRLSLALSTGLFESDTFKYIDPSASVEVSTRRFDVYTTLSVARVELPLHVPIAGAASLTAGPWASMRLTSGLIQNEYLVAPSSFTYPDGERSRTVSSGESLASSRFRYGVSAGLAYDFTIAEGVLLRPELYARVDIASLREKLRERAFSGGAYLSLMAALPSASTPAVLPTLPIAAIDTPTSPPLSGTIDLYLSNDAPLESSGTLERLEIPMAPVITFESETAPLPAALRTMTRERASRITIDSLARLSPAALEARALDVLGMRLREQSGARATIHGSRADDEHAVAVRDYLRDVWGIDSSRVRIGTPTARAMQVEVTPGATIDDPIVTRWITRTYRAPRVGLRHEIDAASGVRFWEIVLRQGERTVARIDEATGDSALATLSLAGIATPLIGELSIVDSTGARHVVRDTLRLNSRTVQGAIERERREYIVAAANVEQRARAIASSIVDGASVSIVELDPGARQSLRMPFTTALLAELARRGIVIAEVRVVNDPSLLNATNAPVEGVSGALRVLVEQTYGAKESE